MDINPIVDTKLLTKVREKENSRLNTRKSSEDKELAKENVSPKTVDILEETVSDKQIIEVVKQANKKLTLANTKYELFYNSERGRLSIKVRNKETMEVVNEIPSENLAKLLDNIWEVTGLIIDEKI